MLLYIFWIIIIFRAAAQYFIEYLHYSLLATASILALNIFILIYHLNIFWWGAFVILCVMYGSHWCLILYFALFVLCIIRHIEASSLLIDIGNNFIVMKGIFHFYSLCDAACQACLFTFRKSASASEHHLYWFSYFSLALFGVFRHKLLITFLSNHII